MPYDDPIVKEVRVARERILKKFGGDLHAYLEYLRKEEKKNPEKLAKIKAVQWVPRPADPKGPNE